MNMIRITLSEKKEFVLTQDDFMQVTYFEYNPKTSTQSKDGVGLGKWADINDVEVQGHIIDQLRIKRYI